MLPSLRRVLARTVGSVLRRPTPLANEDRRVLEQIVFRYYAAQPDINRILFVGCQPYTRHYERAYFPRREFWTIDPDEKLRKFGSSRHVVAPLENLDDFFAEDYFDLILCNGVFGWGLDAPENCERAFLNCHSRLRNDGHLLVGWNDVPSRTPFPIESIESLHRFRSFTFPAFGSFRYLTQTAYRHTYNFYLK
jgi:SAM-dependent methyltransferase